MNPCYLDLETRSKADLKIVGGYNYCRHSSTEVICGVALIGEVAYAWGNLAPFELPMPDDVTMARHIRISAEVPSEVLNHDGPFIAHNAEGFDRWLWVHLGYPEKQWIDTLRQVGKISLPGGLAKLATTLYGRGKDAGGKLMLKLCKPMKNGRFFPVNSQNMQVIVKYCLLDVDLMARAWKDHIEEVYPNEAAVVTVDAKINRKGFLFDDKLAQRIIESDAMNRQESLEALPIDGSVLRSTKQLAEWLAPYEVDLPNFKQATISQYLADNTLPEIVEQVLLGRIGATKITSAKVGRAIGLQGKDGRIRNSLMFHGAHTGRFCGRGFAPQNLPRGVPLDVDDAVERIMTTDWCPNDGELATLIRACIKAPEGKSLLVVDWSQIEARVLPWLAGDTPLLARIRSGVDIYVAMAELMNTVRKIGKVAVLACGYQGGGTTLGAFAEGYGVDFEELGKTAQEVVEMYRDANPLIAGVWTGSVYEGIKCRTGGLWRDMDKGLKEIAWGRATEHFGARCHFFKCGRHLKCRLPSGRELVYRNFTLEDRVPMWGGDAKPTMVYENRHGIMISTYGGKIVENCFAGDTLILTSKGAKVISEITSDDLVWDGSSWVHSDGCIFQGKQEVGKWLGCHVTAEHLIHDGSSWNEVTRLDERGTDRCLELGRSLVPSQSAVAVGFDVSQTAAAEIRESIATGRFDDLKTQVAQNAGTLSGQLRRGINRGSPITRYTDSGTTGTKVSYADAIHRHVLSTSTMGHEGLSCATSGWGAKSDSLSTYGRWIVGVYWVWIWTVQTMIEDMSQGISDWLRDLRTLSTDVGKTSYTTISENCTILPRSGSCSQVDGALKRLGRGLNGDSQSRRSWKPTNKRLRVYDIKNCGPNNRFMVLTPDGPVIAHNCTQAVARDLLTESLVTLDAEGFDTILHIHDEIVVEGVEDQFERMKEIMCIVPEWADGLPIDVDGFITQRFRK